MKDGMGREVNTGIVEESMVLQEVAGVAQSHTQVLIQSRDLLDIIESKQVVWRREWIAERALDLIASTPELTVAKARDQATQEFYAQ